MKGNYFIISECEDFPACILNLLNNHSLTASLVEQAYTLAKNRFDWKHIAANLVNKLSTVIS